MLMASYTNEGNALDRLVMSTVSAARYRSACSSKHVKGYSVARIHGRHLLDQVAP